MTNARKTDILALLTLPSVDISDDCYASARRENVGHM